MYQDSACTDEFSALAVDNGADYLARLHSELVTPTSNLCQTRVFGCHLRQEDFTDTKTQDHKLLFCSTFFNIIFAINNTLYYEIIIEEVLIKYLLNTNTGNFLIDIHNNVQSCNTCICTISILLVHILIRLNYDKQQRLSFSQAFASGHM